ncbi:MAG TPA: PfkB family carbohydrate kinase [Planctomycetota bacterium]|nr:PfkB family carbohydrate kinase [Planctomycetota bacterium]
MSQPGQSQTANRKSQIDVLALGAIAVDDLLFVENYPKADTKTRVESRSREIGGMAAGALIAAARLGARCAYAGVLGPKSNELVRFVEGRLRAEGIDLRHAPRHGDACPIHSIVIVDQKNHTRNIFHHRGGRVGADPKRPAAAVIRSARVLLLDHIGMPGMLRAAKIAKTAGVAIVSDIDRDSAPEFRELFALVDHAIVSQAFAKKLAPGRKPAEAARLLSRNRTAAVVTCGAKGAWFAEQGGKPRHIPAMMVNVVDTTGCGDVFHGAYAAALARGLSVPDCVTWGTVAAALKASGHGHENTPRLRELLRALRAL